MSNLEYTELQQIVQQLFVDAKLSERQKDCLQYFYGFNGYEMTLRQVAQAWGVCANIPTETHQKTLSKLRRYFVPGKYFATRDVQRLIKQKQNLLDYIL